MGTAQTKATNKYKAKAYDRVELLIPKGHKDEYKRLANILGYDSLNNLFVSVVREYVIDSGVEHYLQDNSTNESD